jgi:hypothetical protein
MSNPNNYTTSGIDTLLESIVNLYTDEINAEQSARQRNRTNYPLSFNIQRPTQQPFTRPYTHRNERATPTPTPSPTQQSTNQYHSRYLSIIHTLREIGSQYNNNMREYNTNVRQLLTIVNDIRQDMQTHRTNQTSPVTSPRIPRAESSRFYDGIFGQSQSTRPNQNRSYHRNTDTNPNSNLFDLLFQAIPLPATMENVVIRPNEDQIRNATRSIIYNSNNTRINNNTCPITLEPFEEQQMLTQIMYCGHVFSQDGINRWFEGNVRCPVCRYDIRNYNARCRQCRRPLQEYGTRCTYCEEGLAQQDTQEDMDTEDHDEDETHAEESNEHSDANVERTEDASMNPYQVILNYEIRTPELLFNSADISFNIGR